jgi:hypothetical protein
MNKTCSNCKYWGDGRLVQPDKPNECGKIDTTDTAFIDVQVDDDSNLNVKFMTTANFGCLLHTSK